MLNNYMKNWKEKRWWLGCWCGSTGA